MNEGVLKAVKDWCHGRFQAKGNYLTEVPKGYVTGTELEASFSENMGGAKIAQDAEGNWGLLTPGADAVTPFSSGGGEGIEGLEVLGFYANTSSGTGNIEYIFTDVEFNKNYKNILVIGTYYRSSASGTNVVTDITVAINNTIEILQTFLYQHSNYYYSVGGCLYGAVNEGEKLSFKINIKLTSTNTAIKYYSIAVIGLY